MLQMPCEGPKQLESVGGSVSQSQLPVTHGHRLSAPNREAEKVLPSGVLEITQRAMV